MKTYTSYLQRGIKVMQDIEKLYEEYFKIVK